MLGVAAATALPSEIFPFRKIFLPSTPTIVAPNALNIATLEAIELESFAKAIPDLIFADTSMYKYFKNYPFSSLVSSRALRIPLRNDGPHGHFVWTPNEDQARAIAEKQAQGIDVQAAIDALV
jgi:hypothetical protein